MHAIFESQYVSLLYDFIRMHIVVVRACACVGTECQKLAWKAGHKQGCVPAAVGADARGKALEQVRGQQHDTVLPLTGNLSGIF
jgi:hypothetical protein